MGGRRFGNSLPLGLHRYLTRLLLGYITSLAMILLILHIPLTSSPSPTRWILPRSPDRILVSEVQEMSPEHRANESTSSSADAPSYIHYPVPAQSPRPRTTRDQDPGTGASQTGVSSSDSSRAQSDRDVFTEAEVETPKMIGGMGSFYLQIRYPEAARREGIEGRLRLEFIVTREGRPRAIQVIDSLHPLCDTAAVRALRSVRFRPATYNGTPVAARMTLPVRFRLVPDSTSRRTAQSNSSSPMQE